MLSPWGDIQKEASGVDFDHSVGISKMDFHDYKITDSFIDALGTICKHCTGLNCSCCEIFNLRLSAECQSSALQHKKAHECHRDNLLPDTFAFQTRVNRLTEHDTYYAHRDEDENQYIVTLPRVGCVYHFSVDHIYRCILERKYMIVSDNN